MRMEIDLVLVIPRIESHGVTALADINRQTPSAAGEVGLMVIWREEKSEFEG